MQAVYSCDFQPLPPAQLKRLLPIGHEDEDGKGKEKVTAGGRSYRMATAGGDSKVRVSTP
jgi:chromatin assembly factor 1 subunit B